MYWQLFTYIPPKQGQKGVSFDIWLEELLNHIHAELVTISSDNNVLVRYPAEWKDNYDKNGNLL